MNGPTAISTKTRFAASVDPPICIYSCAGKYLESLGRSRTILSPPSNDYDTDFTLPPLVAYLLSRGDEKRNGGKHESIRGQQRNRHTQARARGTGHTPAGNVGEQEEHDSFTSRPRCSHQNVTNSEPPTAYSRISYGAPLRHALTSPLPSRPASKDDYITDLSYSAGEKEGNHGHASASRITLHRPPSISRVTASNERDLYRPSLSNRFFPPEPGKTRVSTDRATYHRLAHIPTRAEPGQAINDIANKGGRISWRRV